MLKVIINGFCGTMGKVLTKCVDADPDLKLVCGVSPNRDDSSSYRVYPNFSKVNDACDVIIDFSHHLGLDDVLSYAVENKVPLVIATTGYSNTQLNQINEASKVIPIFHSSNMSLGINILLKLVKDATKVLRDFDIEVIEKHHNKKVDSPSGTAIMIANSIKEVLPSADYTYGRHGRQCKRDKNEVGIHAIRGGTIVGEHNVIYAGHDEILELKHIAQSKDIFAKGAITASKYLVNKAPGYYTMNDLLN